MSSPSHNKTAIITGAASGMGLAVAQALSALPTSSPLYGPWTLILIDMNATAGQAAVQTLAHPEHAHFHAADITSYPALSSIFESAFALTGRLDFVFANAGIAERGNFYAQHHHDHTVPHGKAPPAPDLLVSQIDLDTVYTTTYLAQHFMRITPAEFRGSQNQSICMTSSSGGIYPSWFCPLYTAAKHGVVGFMRAISKSFYKVDGIRVNAICPGPVRTNLLSQEQWDRFPDTGRSPVEKIAEVVLMLVYGRDEGDRKSGETRVDDGGRFSVDGGKDGCLLWGNAVEISGLKHYYRDAPRYSDEVMEGAMLLCDPTRDI